MLRALTLAWLEASLPRHCSLARTIFPLSHYSPPGAIHTGGWLTSRRRRQSVKMAMRKGAGSLHLRGVFPKN